MEALVSLEAAEARLAQARAEPSQEAAPALADIEAQPLEGPEPWESEIDGADQPPVPPPPPAADEAIEQAVDQTGEAATQLPGSYILNMFRGLFPMKKKKGIKLIIISKVVDAPAEDGAANGSLPPPPLALDEQAVVNGYARIAGASEDVTQVLLEKKVWGKNHSLLIYIFPPLFLSF